MAYATYPVLDNADETGPAVDWPGGKGVVTAYTGTFGGTTANLQWSPDDGTTWLDVDSSGDTFTTFTAAGAGAFELPACKLRMNVAGGAPSGLYATVKGVR